MGGGRSSFGGDATITSDAGGFCGGFAAIFGGVGNADVGEVSSGGGTGRSRGARASCARAK